MFKQIFCCLLLLPSLLFAATPNVAPATPLPDADKLLVQIVDGAIIPLYRELQVTANTLAQRSTAFCSAPTAESFKVLREGWGETLLAWHRTDALMFGPAIADQIDFTINFTPPKKMIISRLLTDEIPLTPDIIAKAGVGGQGLSTLEFLLFDRDKSEAEQLASFQGDTGKRRCDYVQAASTLLHTQVQTIANGWLQDSNGYASAFRDAHKGNATFASARQAVDLLVGKLYQSAEKFSKNRIGNPLGKGIDLNTEGKQEVLNTSNAYQLEAWRSGYSIQIIRANVEGMQRILREGGVLQWLRDHNEREVEKFVADAMQQRLDNYLKLPLPSADPFELIKTGKGKELDGYYYLGNDIQMGIRRQLAKVLGVQLGFNDNDGD
ncbi:imelysin family protein [Thiothrix winogradskyi]|uniref:Imelysin family protein n=1 Tax=Thiothrix winogradskyi TaxID=96472 RepID=A0ABY3ST66_9GAMM|nr:imelysin family protein [Thiothrix winogradskyi]UJS22630.1 imelysin family protein [Thiothrix winogradskyi]